VTSSWSFILQLMQTLVWHPVMGSLSVMSHYFTTKVRIFFIIEVHAFLLTALKLVHSLQYLAYGRKSVVWLKKKVYFIYFIFPVSWFAYIQKASVHCLCISFTHCSYWPAVILEATLYWHAVAYWEEGLGVFKPPPRNSESPPKSCQTQPDCENC